MKPLAVTLAVGLLMLLATPSAAQFYDNSLGLRLGTTSAMTYKRFITKEQALELLVSGRKDGFQLTTLYEFSTTSSPTAEAMRLWKNRSIGWILILNKPEII